MERLNWSGFRLLEVLGDLFLIGLLKGCIVEIGIGESSGLLKNLAVVHKRKIFHCDISKNKLQTYQNKGYFGDNLIFLDEESIVDYSGVQCILYGGSSDTFFDQIKLPPVAMGFIDGCHNYEQVKRDFNNLLQYVVPDGVVFLHDTFPISEDYVQCEARGGTVYKLRQDLEKTGGLDCFTFTKTVGDSMGITMVRKKKTNLPYYQE